jgi:2-dehydro-3-deoxygalactonokinase
VQDGRGRANEEEAARVNWRSGYIAVDWGTTNRRAYALDGDGRLTDSFADDLGLMAVPAGGFEAAAAEIRTRLGDRPMLLAGMVGSNRGWREAPYAPCPAGAAELKDAILWIEPGRTGLVPGVSQVGAAGADVMRGEEVQVLGAVAAGLVPPDVLICHPGTHAKWIEMRGGRIASFRTMMTGEVFALLSKHSILADQLKSEVRPGDAFRTGARETLGGAHLLSALFGVRADFLLKQGPDDLASYASGLLIGADVRAGLEIATEAPIALIGRPDLCTLYADALELAGRSGPEIDGAAAFRAGMHMLVEML